MSGCLKKIQTLVIDTALVRRDLLPRFRKVLYSHLSLGDLFFHHSRLASICLNENCFLHVPRTTLIRALKELKEELKSSVLKRTVSYCYRSSGNSFQNHRNIEIEIYS